MSTQAEINTSLDIPKMVIVMKSGLTFWVTKETGERAQAHLERQQAHSFMRIAELGETINTAEIAGVHSPEVYDELQRFKAGEFKCQWGKWHGKKQSCECKAEAFRAHRRIMREIESTEDSRPLTPEQRARNTEAVRKIGEMGALDGSPVFRGFYLKGGVDGKKVRRSTILEWQDKYPDREPQLEGLLIDEDII